MARTVDPAKHEAKRAQIMTAAYRCFAQKGFAATTTADICRAAGMSTGNLFHYFPSKRAIFSAIFEEDTKKTALRLRQAAISEDPWGGLLEYLAHTLHEAADPGAGGFLIAVIAQAQQDPEFAAQLGRNDTVQLEGLTALLVRAAELGQTDRLLEPGVAATWLAVILDGAFVRLAGNPDVKPLEQLPALTLLVSRFLGAEVREDPLVIDG